MQFLPRHARLCGVAALFVVSLVLPSLALAQITPEEAKLIASLDAGAQSGASVAISGTTAVVGAPHANGDTGAAYVYTRSGVTWTYQATLTASDGAAADGFGTSVSISTDVSSGNIAVGAPGHNSGAGAVYVFTGSGASWTQNPSLSNAGNSGNLGTSVSIEGFVVAAGAPHASVSGRANVGVVVVFSFNGTSWTRTTVRPNGGQARTGGQFGTSVALSGNTLAGGAPNYHRGNKANSGALFIFANNGAGWTQQANLLPSNQSGLFVGQSVALAGNTVVAGGPGASGSGRAYVYTRSGTTWGGLTTLAPVGGANGDQFGASVAVQGGIAIVGAPNATGAGGATSGKAYVFSTVGVQLNTFVASDNAAGDNFGASVAADGGRAVIGAPLATAGGGGAGDGAAYVFQYQTTSVTTITSPAPATTSLVGVPYPVSVHVDHDVGGSGIPTGTVTVTDDQGGTCDAVILLDANGDGTCNLTSTSVGVLTIKASYSGDLLFSASDGFLQHQIIGHHLVFNPDPPPFVLQGDQVNGVVVEVQDENNVLITTDSSTNVALTVDDTCGNTGIVIGTLQVAGGVATFTNVGPRFYTLDPGTLALHATADDGSAPANTNIGVIFNAEYLFADSFEDCRL